MIIFCKVMGLIRHRNRCKFVEGRLFAIIDLLLLGAKFITLYLIWRVGDDFNKNSQIFYFVLFFLIITAP